MPRDVALDTLYNGKINLWVEDELMRTYLGALWNEPAVKFLIGGGSTGVNAILRHAEDAEYKNVFGVADRDHGRSNYADWLVPGRKFTRFILPRHEIENYLLDSPALAGCRLNTRRLTAAEIDQILVDEAATRCWWAACRDAVSLIRERFFDNYIEHPKMPPVDTEIAARDHITQSDWFRALPRKSTRMTDDKVLRLLTWTHKRASRRLDDGSWRVHFSGKEFFRWIGGRISKRDAASSKQPSRSGFDTDLAKAVAAWQVGNNAVPADLGVLLKALKARIQP